MANQICSRRASYQEVTNMQHLLSKLNWKTLYENTNCFSQRFTMRTSKHKYTKQKYNKQLRYMNRWNANTTNYST